MWKTWYGEVEEKDGDYTVKKTENFIKAFRKSENAEPLPFNLPEVGLKVFKSIEDYYKTLRKIAITVTEEDVEKELKREDRYAILLLKALDKLNESINMLEEKLRDVEEVKVSEVTDEFRESIERLKALRRRIEKEIEDIVTKIAPNLSEIAGPLITARLLEKAGSLERLAFLPGSKIQILGAEKSLYKALARMRRGKRAKTPKHGIIFLHPFIRTLPKKKRGKMARFMAAKLAIAARLDYFRGELDEKLAEEVRRKYEELRRSK
ncbi:RNA-processing protein [Archaeoglobus sp.]